VNPGDSAPGVDMVDSLTVKKKKKKKKKKKILLCVLSFL